MARCFRQRTRGLVVAASFLVLMCTRADAQTTPSVATQPPVTVVEPSNESVTLTYFNRPITNLRARVFGRLPTERAAQALRQLEALVGSGRPLTVETRPTEGGILILVGPQVVIGLTPIDIDPLAGETVQSAADAAARRLQEALNEAVDSGRPRVWIQGAAVTLVSMVLAVFVLWGLLRLRRRLVDRLSTLTSRIVARFGLSGTPALRASHVLNSLNRWIVSFAVLILALFAVYSLLSLSLRQFPYTRPWGASLRGSLFDTLRGLGQAFVTALPGLITVLIILSIARLVVRILRPWFDAVEQSAVRVPWVHPDTAATTRRLVTAVIWLLGAAIAYPYVPGSETEAFKGISVFVGLIVTLGSSGLVNQIMSGFMVTYSRALKEDDFVRIGDVEGTITEMGLLSVKIRTLRSEHVTIPNALVVSQTVTDYSRFADSVLTTTSVTIGYDEPWRQVHALLLLAAERTPGLRREPKPRVAQTALEDAAVNYTVVFCLESHQTKIVTLNALHEQIQDLFNEYGVQIMTPRYEADPAAPKLVPKGDWFKAPASTNPPIKT